MPSPEIGACTLPNYKQSRTQLQQIPHVGKLVRTLNERFVVSDWSNAFCIFTLHLMRLNMCSFTHAS